MESKKPLVGIYPPYIYAEKCRQQRIQDIADAVHRYMSAQQPVPARWLTEYAALLADTPTEDLDARAFSEAYGPNA